MSLNRRECLGVLASAALGPMASSALNIVQVLTPAAVPRLITGAHPDWLRDWALILLRARSLVRLLPQECMALP